MKVNCIAKSKLKDILLGVDDDVWLRSIISRKIHGNGPSSGSVYLAYHGLRTVEYMSATKCEIVFGFVI